MTDQITIPTPLVAPFGLPVDMPEHVHEVWDAFVKPEQESETPPSVEMRVLMAILRAVHDGLHARKTCSHPTCVITDNDATDCEGDPT